MDSSAQATAPTDEHYDAAVWKTPAMQQFVRFKREHPDCLLLFRMGDFYELFGNDAKVAHQALAITLTERTSGMPMAGVPHHALDGYLKRLVEQGHRVAICDQVQDPREAKGVVDRAVTRVVTPGTLVEESLLEAAHGNLIASVLVEGNSAAIAAAELSTGSFELFALNASELSDELARIAPAELIHVDTPEQRDVLALQTPDGCSLSPRTAASFDAGTTERGLLRFYGVASLDGFGFQAASLPARAAGALLEALRRTQPNASDKETSNGLSHLTPPRLIHSDTHLRIDATSLRSLEIDRTVHAGSTEGSLLWALQRGRTPMGRRMLRRWLCRPLRDRNAIESRQKAIGACIADPAFADGLRDRMAGIQDIARIAGRVSMRRATPRDVVALGRSLSRIVELIDAISERPAFESLRTTLNSLGVELAPIEERLTESCVEDPPAHLREGGLFRDGIDETLDEARELQSDSNAWLARYQVELAETHSINTLKVGFNKVFGYYIELSNANRDKAPDSFTRKQTLKNAERYVTPELKRFEERVTNAESRALACERAMFDDLLESIAEHTESLIALGETVAELDCLAGLAERAASGGWCAPQIEDNAALEITRGRHPVLEQLLNDAFVANDCALGTSESPATLSLITGPNMAGKSTFIRQVALITLLAHVGSWVPAEAARIGLTDRISTRIGASDELHAGRSTFMVEMTETAGILNTATDRSLVILDEIGRGTSTLDGLALAWSIAESLARRGTRTLFATHYHELTALAEQLEAVGNLHVTVREWNNKIVFLHQLQPGSTDRSYGLHVARLAGLPKATIDRAEEVLQSLAVHTTTPRSVGPPPEQLPLFREYLPHPVLDRLREVSVESLTPLAAFDLVRELVDDVESS